MAFDQNPYALAEPEVEQASDEQLQREALVKKWLNRIARAKARWKDDYERMRANMEFVGGLQHSNQKKIHDHRYLVNIALTHLKHKVATLYAKNPTVSATRRPRMDFQIWDESVESLQEALVSADMMVQSGQEVPPELSALIWDIQNGRAKQKLVSKVGETIQKATQYFVDAHKPDFKEQSKQMVRRACVCSVGYVKPIFCTSGYSQPSSIDHGSDFEDRLGRIKSIVDRLEDEDGDQKDSHLETLRALVTSLGYSQAFGEQEDELPERIEFDFPPATSIIPDWRCRSLKDFVGGRWVAQEYILPISEINAIFGIEVKSGTSNGEAKPYEPAEGQIKENDQQWMDDPDEKLGYLYEVFDYSSKTVFFVVDGYKDFVQTPSPDPVPVSGFWKLFALTFNDTEVEEDLRISIFPQSDVDLIRHPQMEWNRTRDALRAQRNANAPKYLTRKGQITEEDIENLRNCEPNGVVEISGALDIDLTNLLIPLQSAKIDPALYDTAPLETDMMIGAGLQKANLGPAEPDVTATVGTIAEQSRMDVSSSDVDDLDGVLSRLFQAVGEMILKGCSKETILRVVGDGAVFPESREARRDFVNEIFLNILGASSGRPNKAMEIANFRDLAPLLMQSGANPARMVEEGVRRLDDRLEIDEFFPLAPPQLGNPNQSQLEEDSDSENPDQLSPESEEPAGVRQSSNPSKPGTSSPPGVHSPS